MMPYNSYIHSRYVTETTSAQAAAFVDDAVALFDNFDGNNPAAPLLQNRKDFINRQFLCVYVLRGRLNLTIDGQPRVFEANYVNYITARSIIRVDSVSDDFYYFLYSTSSSLLHDVYNDMGMVFKMPSQFRRFEQKKLTPEEMKHRLTLYNEQRRDLGQTAEAYRRTVAQVYQCILCSFDIDLLEPDRSENEKAVSRQKLIFRRFIDLLDQQSQRQREVQYYARQLGITPKYLSSLCIEYGGKNASAWIDDYVISRVKNLMQERRYTIKEISQLMNFPTQSFFGRYFKRVVGMSPRKYLASQK